MSQRIHIAAGAAAVFGLVLLAASALLNTVNGLQATVTDEHGSPGFDFTAQHAMIDGHDLFETEGVRVTLRGFLAAGDLDSVVVRTDGAVTVTTGGEVVLEEPGTGVLSEYVVPAEPGPIRVDYVPSGGDRPLLTLGTPGARLRPERILFPAEPTADESRRANTLAAVKTVGHALLITAGIGAVAGVGLAVREGRITARRVALLAALCLLAFGLRGAVIVQRAANDPALLTMPVGSDQRTFERQARGLLQGTWPGGEGYYHQPGMPYTLFILHEAVGPGILPVRLAMAALHALLPRVLVDMGRRLFDEEAIGWIAAGLFAVFPGAIYYAGTGLTTPAAILLAAVFLWLVSIIVSEPPAWGAAVGAGIVLALLVIHRQNFMLLLPVLAIWLVFGKIVPRRQAAGLTAAITAAAVIVFAPVPAHNHAAGANYLSTPIGAQIWYMGNNRDSTGYFSTPQAWRAAKIEGERYTEAFWEDVRAEPIHWVQLLMYKTSLFWDAGEVSSNLSYANNGLDASWLLRSLRPFTFSVMAFLGISGGVLSVFERRQSAWLLHIFILVTMVTAVGFTPESRIRAPIAPALALLAGYFIWRTVGIMRSRGAWRLPAGIAAGTLAVLAMLAVITDRLPLPRLHPPDGLPADATPLDLTFGDRLRLVGYALRDPGDADPGLPLIVTLYWQRMAPLEHDYSVFLHQLNPDNEQVGAITVDIGTISHQRYPTSQWGGDRIFQEEYMILPQPGITRPLTTTIWVGVLNEETGERLLFFYERSTVEIYTLRLNADQPTPDPD
ncbi:MAG: hypothetical protein GYB64_05485, partial [Chloroflexi bacterium]|nr:hypothetical protein [Chloroflexota bacterium]